MQDAPDKVQYGFTVRSLPVVFAAFLFYIVSFIFLDISIILMPMGCDYASRSGINLVFGLLSLIIVVGGSLWIYRTYRSVLATPVVTDAASEGDLENKVRRLLTQLNNVGAQATLSSAFVWYGLCYTSLVGGIMHDDVSFNAILEVNIYCFGH